MNNKIAAAALTLALALPATSAFADNGRTKGTIIGAAAGVSEDILAGLKTIGKSIKTDPFGAIFRILDAMRGRAPQPRTPTGDTRPASLEGDR